MADHLQRLYEGSLLNPATGKPFRKLMLNVFPRAGKSYTIHNFCEWVFGQNINEKILSVAYNEKLSGIASKSVRDTIQGSKTQPWRVIYNDVFPDTRGSKGGCRPSDVELGRSEGEEFSGYVV